MRPWIFVLFAVFLIAIGVILRSTKSLENNGAEVEQIEQLPAEPEEPTSAEKGHPRTIGMTDEEKRDFSESVRIGSGEPGVPQVPAEDVKFEAGQVVNFNDSTYAVSGNSRWWRDDQGVRKVQLQLNSSTGEQVWAFQESLSTPE